MAMPSFSEAEVFLLGEWGSSRRIEAAMKTIRDKYSIIAQRIIEQVKGRHSEFDASIAYVTQHWGVGYIGLGRKAWGASSNGWPAGYYVNNLRLEVLTDETAEFPFAYMDVKPAVRMGLKPEVISRAVKKCAEEGVGRKELESWQFSEDPEEIAAFRLPFNRKELLEMLCKGDSQEFVDCIASCFDPLAKFNAILDGAIRGQK